MSSAELAQKVLKVKIVFYWFFFISCGVYYAKNILEKKKKKKNQHQLRLVVLTYTAG